MSGHSAMDPGGALAVLREHRAIGDVVITSMGSAREWMAMGPLDPLDFVFVPSSNGSVKTRHVSPGSVSWLR